MKVFFTTPTPNRIRTSRYNPTRPQPQQCRTGSPIWAKEIGQPANLAILPRLARFLAILLLGDVLRYFLAKEPSRASVQGTSPLKTKPCLEIRAAALRGRRTREQLHHFPPNLSPPSPAFSHLSPPLACTYMRLTASGAKRRYWSGICTTWATLISNSTNYCMEGFDAWKDLRTAGKASRSATFTRDDLPATIPVCIGS